MLQIGKYNDLRVVRLTAIGAYLESEAGDILLPTKYVPQALQPGETLRVFVHLDSEDRLVATTLFPKAQVGEFAVMTVRDVTPVGVFLEWGLEKDLLVPFSEQRRPMQKGEKHLVRVYLDRSDRIAASTKINKFLESTPFGLRIGQEVELMLYEFTELGAKMIINGRFVGLLFKSELFGRHEVGERLKGYVSKIRADGKVDVTLRKAGVQETDRMKETLIAALQRNGGFLDVGDKTPPERIAHLLQMSKKTFKRVVGNLYKEGIVEISEAGVRLVKR